uniref:Mucin n=1 Tax=Rhipicephalus appendiculatus TaxID=34631 RepID=A0A131YUA8_RHIAP
MVKHWSRKLWFVALCAALCATLTVADEDSQGQSQEANGSQQSSDSQEPIKDSDSPTEEGNSNPDSKNGTVNAQGPPKDDNPDCNTEPNKPHIYNSCEFVCGMDEVVLLNQSQPCYVSDREEGPQVPVPSQRSDGERLQGVCKEGKCDASNSSDIAEPKDVRRRRLFLQD